MALAVEEKEKKIIMGGVSLSQLNKDTNTCQVTNDTLWMLQVYLKGNTFIRKEQKIILYQLASDEVQPIQTPNLDVVSESSFPFKHFYGRQPGDHVSDSVGQVFWEIGRITKPLNQPASTLATLCKVYRQLTLSKPPTTNLPDSLTIAIRNLTTDDRKTLTWCLDNGGFARRVFALTLCHRCAQLHCQRSSIEHCIGP